MAGRPPTGERKVVIQVLVRPVVKEYLKKRAAEKGETLSTFLNGLIEHWWNH